MGLLSNKTFSRIKTISIYGVSQVVGPFSHLFLSYLIVNIHSVALWGAYAELFIWMGLIITFVSFGNNDYLLRNFSLNPSGLWQLWFSNTLSRTVLLIPAILFIIFLGVSNDILLLLIIWLILFFVNQSFRVIILFHKNFVFNVLAEVIPNLFVILFVLIIRESLELYTILLFVICFHFIKATFYLFYYRSEYKKLNFEFSINHLKNSISYFIPLAVGTVSYKMDSYYGTIFFDDFNLSRYQILVNFLGLAQMSSVFILNPFLKNYYRLDSHKILKVQQRFFFIGFVFSALLILMIYAAITLFFHLDFTLYHYLLGGIFMIPIFLHTLVVNEFYKEKLQKKVALFTMILVASQLITGYFLFKELEITGALILKAASMWMIAIAMWIYIRKKVKISKY